MTALVIDGPEWWALAHGDKVAAVLDDDQLTYSELEDWAKRIAATIREQGVNTGDRVGIVAGNSLAYCALGIGLLKAGAVAVPMSTRLTAAELGVLTSSSEPRAVVVDNITRATVEQVDGPPLQLVDIEELEELRTGEPTAWERPDIDPDEPAALIYTSGTTGTPKGVIFTNRTILGFIQEWGMLEPHFTREMRLLMVLPLGGAPGLLWGVFHTFVRGGTLVLQRQFHPAGAVDLLARERINAMVGVPILYEQIAVQPGFADADLSELGTAFVGGARVSENLLRTFADKGVALRQIYGMTEAGGILTATPRQDALTKPDRCGKGAIFSRFKVVRDDGSECAPGETGEILLRGPAVTPGYWRNPEATATAIRDGWFHSGDLGEVDEDGSLRMVDRLKDLIITGGLNVAPAEIESVIDELPAVAEVAVVPAEDHKFGETPAAIVRLQSKLSAAEIVAHCNERLADYKVPRYVVVVDEPLPRMASGKVAKRVLRERHPDIAGTHEKVR